MCHGRVVSVLEGGYRIQGDIVSAFSRSVAAHVHALHERNDEAWNEADAAAERADERRRKEVKAAERERKIAARKAKFAAEVAELRAEAAEAMDTVPVEADKGDGVGHGAEVLDAVGMAAAAAMTQQQQDAVMTDANSPADAGTADTGTLEAFACAAAVGGGNVAKFAAGAAAVAGHDVQLGESGVCLESPQQAEAALSTVQGGTAEAAVGLAAALPEKGLVEARPGKRRRGAAVDYVALNKQLLQDSALDASN